VASLTDTSAIAWHHRLCVVLFAGSRARRVVAFVACHLL
jgi:hypothetical protein